MQLPWAAVAAPADGSWWTDEGPFWVSLGSLVVSLAAAGIAWRALRRTSPRLVVLTRNDVTIRIGGPGPRQGEFERYTVHVTVINETGAEVTVNDVGLAGVRNGKPFGQHVSFGFLREQGTDVDGPELPHRLGGHDNADWSVAGPHAFGPLKGFGQYFAYCARFARRDRSGLGIKRFYDRQARDIPGS